MVTVTQHLGAAIEAVSPNSRRTYASGMRQLERALGDRQLSQVHLADLERVRDRVRTEAGVRTVTRARARGRRLRAYDPDAYGRGAAENFVSSTRFFFNHARAAGLLVLSPAAELRAPR